MSAARRLFALVFVIVLVSDQASKLWLYFIADIAARQPIAVLPFMDFILVWNRGISYGLMQQSTELGRWALTLFKLAAAIGLSAWAWQANDRVLALALGLIAGGALGNAIDRILYGAVLDFVHLFWGTFSWYVFNIADAAIVVGVMVLLYDAVRPGPKVSSE
jgi:signal peptidase II